MNVTHPTTDPYHYFQSSTESSKKLCKSFLEQFHILYDSQYGFREKRSTEHAILEITNQIQTNMDRKLYTCGIFIDLQKAFNTVDHSILLKKLDHYGIRGIVNDWFTSYLTSRKQISEIGPLNISKKATVLSGVQIGRAHV